MARSSPDGRIKVLVALEGVLGGTLRHLDLLLRYTDPAEFDVHLALSAHRAEHVHADFARWQADGWTVHEIDMCREIRPARDLRAFMALRALCLRERFGVVHTHCAKAGFLGRLAGRIAGARTVHTPHVFPFSHDIAPFKRGIYRRLERMAARWTDRFILLTDYQLNLLLAAGIAPAERATIIPNGVTPDQFEGLDRREARRELAIDPDAPVALFAGRFREQKGVDVLVEAARLLGGRGTGLRIVIVGEGPQEGWLREQIARPPLAGMLLLHGLTDRMPLYYAACDMVVMPSRAEGMPYVALEAKAAGRPVVATLVTGMEKLIEHGRDGFLVPPENPEALAGILAELAADRERLERAGRRAREGLTPRWHAETCARAVHKVYRELASSS